MAGAPGIRRPPRRLVRPRRLRPDRGRHHGRGGRDPGHRRRPAAAGRGGHRRDRGAVRRPGPGPAAGLHRSGSQRWRALRRGHRGRALPRGRDASDRGAEQGHGAGRGGRGDRHDRRSRRGRARGARGHRGPRPHPGEHQRPRPDRRRRDAGPARRAGGGPAGRRPPAVDALRAAAAGVTVTDPAIPLLSNLDGAAVASGADWLERIITQVSAPVRWADCMLTMADLGTSAFVELLPGGTLTGLARRALPGVATAALKTPDDLTAARSLLAEHGAPDPFEYGHLPEWRLLVSPHDGTFRAGRPERVPAPGVAVASGAALGHVEVRTGQHAIAPGYGGTIIEWLVEDGDPVNAGQPLVRLLPEGAE